MDQWLINFFSHNVLTMSVIMHLLKGIAILIPGVKDDKIVTLLINIYNMIKTGVIPKTISCDDLEEKEK
jgi:hypothetical protein